MADTIGKLHKRKIRGIGDNPVDPAASIDPTGPGAGASAGAETGAPTDTGADTGPDTGAPAPVGPVYAETPLGSPTLAGVTTPKLKSGKPVGYYAQKKPETKQDRSKANDQTAATLITVAETLAISLAGDEAALQDAERTLIVQSLPKVLDRMTPAAMAQVESVTFPAMLLLGLGVYGLRVATLLQAKTARAKADKGARAPALVMPVTQPGTNGGTPAAGATDKLIVSGGADNLASHDGREFINSRGVDSATTQF